MPKPNLAQLVRDKEVLVCCGAGGVGKTSIAAAIGLGAARMGRRVLVVTIDPSKRLAESLGVSQNTPHPVQVTPARLAAAGIELMGQLHTWMLDPQVVSDGVVKRLGGQQAEVEMLLHNAMYRNITSMVAGMQEYTAVQAMYDFVRSGAYDLVVLDTPPSRNALHFLDAPGRIAGFLDGRVFRFFAPSVNPKSNGLIKRAASHVLNKVMDATFGEETRSELLTFFSLFSGILRRLNHNATHMRQYFASEAVAFLVVTSPAREALEEARYFEQRTRVDLKLPLAGYILNRSLAHHDGRQLPNDSAIDFLSQRATQALRTAAHSEQQRTLEHRELLDTIAERLGSKCFVQVAPYLDSGVSDLSSLAMLSAALT